MNCRAVCLSVSITLGAANALAAQTPLLDLKGSIFFDRLGQSVRAAGDVDRDGFPDYIVGVPTDGRASGEAFVVSGKDGRTIHNVKGDSRGDRFGISVSGAGDVNKDGFPDFIVGAYFDDNKGVQSGMIRVFSGKDGKVLYSRDGDAGSDYFGQSVSGAGDVNNDGYDDFIAGAALNFAGQQRGYARVFSGKDGATLYTFRGDSAFDRFGTSVSGVGDVNKDGFDDVAVGATMDDNNGGNSGSIRVLSGKDGKVLYTFNGDSAGDQLGISVSDASDVNRDGFPDLIAGAWFDDNTASDAGSARVYSGKDGKVLYTFNGDAASDLFGVSVSGAGDTNGDGVPDLIVGAYQNDQTGKDAGSARVFSGKDGKTLFTIYGDRALDEFGLSVTGIGDTNGDGSSEVVVGAPGWDDIQSNSDGLARVYSGSRAALTADTFELSLKVQGKQTLSLDAGNTNPFRDYWIFGSLTGVKPGVPLGPVRLPLVPDVYTDLALGLPSPFFAGFRGKLDVTGKATATFNVPANLPPVVGVTLFHAALVFDASSNVYYLGSNAVPLRLFN